MVFPQIGEPSYDPQYIALLIIKFPKKSTPNLGKPPYRGRMILGTQLAHKGRCPGLGVPTMNYSIWENILESPFYVNFKSGNLMTVRRG